MGNVIPFDLLDWMSFPWCCENVEWDKPMDDQYWTDEPDMDEIAFYCKAHPHRILIQECLGMDCPMCKIRHHDVYIKHLKE